MKEAPRCRGDAFLEGGLRTSSSQAPKHWLLLEELSGSGDDVPEGLLVGDALFDPGDDFGARPFNICRMPGPNSWKRLMPAWLMALVKEINRMLDEEEQRLKRRKYAGQPSNGERA